MPMRGVLISLPEGQCFRVAEDSSDIGKTGELAFTRHMPARLGYLAVEANGSAAEALLRKPERRIQFVVETQAMGGLELAERFRAVRADLELLFTSNYSNANIQPEGLFQRAV